MPSTGTSRESSFLAIYAFVNTESAPLAKELILFPRAR
jgi:hypothetical protein